MLMTMNSEMYASVSIHNACIQILLNRKKWEFIVDY